MLISVVPEQKRGRSTMAEEAMKDFFISYSKADRGWAE